MNKKLITEEQIPSCRILNNIPDLEELLKKAPKEVSYEPHNNGFYLKNDFLRMQYTKTYFGGRDSVCLWFLSIQPKIKLSGGYIDMEEVPKSLICNYICAHTGDTFLFTSPLDGSIGNTFGIRRNPVFPDKPTGPKEWFDKGTHILQQAAKKYKLKHWYETYSGKSRVIENVTRPELITNIKKYFLRLSN